MASSRASLILERDELGARLVQAQGCRQPDIAQPDDGDRGASTGPSQRDRPPSRPGDRGPGGVPPTSRRRRGSEPYSGGQPEESTCCPLMPEWRAYNSRDIDEEKRQPPGGEAGIPPDRCRNRTSTDGWCQGHPTLQDRTASASGARVHQDPGGTFVRPRAPVITPPGWCRRLSPGFSVVGRQRAAGGRREPCVYSAGDGWRSRSAPARHGAAPGRGA